MKGFRRALALFLSVAMMFSVAACKNGEDISDASDKSQTSSGDTNGDGLALTPDVNDYPANRRDGDAERTNANATQPLVISTLTLDGKFSPFFGTGATDRDVYSQTQITLIGNNEFAEPVAGVDEPVLAYDYTMTVAEDQSETTYEFVLKSGVRFSDGQLVNADDVLFNLYMYLDPQYDGSSTLYSMAIKGLTSYRNQIADESQAEGKAKEFADNAQAAVDAALAGNDADTLEKIWTTVGNYITADSTDLLAYIAAGYTLADFGVAAEFPEDMPADMTIAGYYGAVTYADGAYVFDESTGLNNEGVAGYKEEDYVAGTLAFVKATMTPEEFDGGFGWTAVDDTVTQVSNEFRDTFLEENKGTVKSVNGIKKGLKLCDDDVVRETITVTIDGVDPKAIWNFGFEIAPMHYYAGQERHDQANGTDYFGVDFSSAAFMNEVKSLNGLPMGAGPYKVTDAKGSESPTADGFYDAGTAYLVANDYYLMSAPNIKYLRFKTIASGSEMDSVKTGEVHYSTPQASSTSINLISSDAEYSHLNYFLVDYLGYGYIGINAEIIKDLNERRAIMSAMNIELTLNNYPGGLAEVIHRPMSKVSWAYPQDAQARYPYDATGETSKQLFLDAGYQEKDGKIVDAAGNALTYTFTLPSSADSHPAGHVFLDTKEVLEKIGVTVNVEVDDGLLNKLNEGIIAVWAAAWQATIDPDMFQVYYSDATENSALSPKSYGLFNLFEKGTDEEKQILTELNEAILQGRKSLNVDERKPIYSKACDLVMDIAVELPTYQRKEMLAFNKEVIDETSLLDSSKITPYKGPLAEIWNVSLLGE